MNYKSLIFSLISLPVIAGTTLYQNFQSSYICSSGTVTDKEPVIQTGVDLYNTIEDNYLYHIGAFANYAVDTVDGYYTEDYLFNEIDVFIGLAYSNDNLWFSLDYEYWHYPHIIGEDTQNVIHYIFSYTKIFTYTLGGYYYINDGYNYLIDINPSITYKYKLTDNIKLSLTTGIYYRLKDYDHINGFNSCNFKLNASYKNLSVFYRKWYQVDSRLDSDYNNNLKNDCYGMSLSFDF